jgi:hypothetical protein
MMTRFHNVSVRRSRGASTVDVIAHQDFHLSWHLHLTSTLIETI